MKKILSIAVLLFLGVAVKCSAASLSSTISSTSFVSGFAASDVLLLNPNESMTYSLTGGATGTIVLEKSVDGYNYNVIFSSVNNNPTGTRTGVEYSYDRTTFYRWRASTMAGLGSFVVTLDDNDDYVGQIQNNKRLPVLQWWDDTIRYLNNKGIFTSDVIPSTFTTSGNSFGNIVPVYLTGSIAAVEGSVLVATTPVAGKGVSVVVAPALSNLGSPIGVARKASAVGNSIEMYTSGFVLARTTGTVNPGDPLVTSSLSAGYLATLSASSTTVVGVSLATGNSAGGLTKIKLVR